MVTLCAVTVLWPLNIPLVALAYKVRQGTKPIDMEPGEFWWRCTFATLGLAGFSLVLLGLNYFLVTTVQMPLGPVQTVLFLVYLAAAIGYVFWMFARDDMLEAISIFLLYVLLPGLPLLLIGRLTHFWETVTQWAPWLLSPS
jgi:hypothetical protein